MLGVTKRARRKTNLGEKRPPPRPPLLHHQEVVLVPSISVDRPPLGPTPMLDQWARPDPPKMEDTATTTTAPLPNHIPPLGLHAQTKQGVNDCVRLPPTEPTPTDHLSCHAHGAYGAQCAYSHDGSLRMREEAVTRTAES